MNLKIRKMTINDAGSLYGLLSDPKVMKYLEHPYSKEQTEQFLIKAGLSEKPLIYAIENNDNFIGYLIYHDYDEENMEIGWVLHPSYWHKGIATILTSQMIEKTKRNGKHVIIECVPEQKSTRRIAEKFGFQNIGMDKELMVYRL